MSNRLELLKARIDRLRIPRERIAELSGLDKATISRAFNAHTDPLTSTLDKIEAAVTAEEQSMAQHLAGITNPGAAA